MSTIDTLLQRNHEFVARRFVAGLSMRPTLQTIIISCADPRVDPVHILGLEPGEAVVLRNVGGRVTPGTLQLLRMLLQIPTGASTPTGNNASSPFHLIVLQHTDCGITRLASNTALMADYFGVPPAELPAKAIAAPRAAVASDVATLRAIPGLPPALLVSGLVYDTETGLVDIAVPPAPIRPATAE
ncbi:MAG TPA: carbonic anhydrase [Ktedonobacterales bacterium]|jgi:carbonic anhydrase|nr:carbonic anhydrase [Ktedonobacterales bacterium]